MAAGLATPPYIHALRAPANAIFAIIKETADVIAPNIGINSVPLSRIAFNPAMNCVTPLKRSSIV